MRIVCQTFSLPKQGRELSDYEDASYPYCENQFTCIEAHPEIDTYRCAVTDGATDSVFSKQWAQILAAAYGAGEWAEELSAQSLVKGQAQWQEFVGKQQLPWYAEEKVQLGAFSAFVGLTLLNEGQRWRAVAVGDCCLFHTRGNKVIEAFPITKSADFSNFPFLLATLADRNEGVFEQKSVRSDGRWESGDVFLLMSDALAAWFLRQVEDGYGEPLIDWLTKLELQDVFAEVVQTQRGQINQEGISRMRDDDVTLVRVCVGSKAAPMPVSVASGSSTADSIQTLTLDDKGKEYVRSRTANNETQQKSEPSNAAPPQSPSRAEPPRGARNSSSAEAPTARTPAFLHSPPAPTGGASSGAAQRQAERDKATVRRRIILAVGVVGLISLIAVGANSMIHPKSNLAPKPSAAAAAPKPVAAHDAAAKKQAESSPKGNKPRTAGGANRRAHEAKERSNEGRLLKEGTSGIDPGADSGDIESVSDRDVRDGASGDSAVRKLKRASGSIPGFKEDLRTRHSAPTAEDADTKAN